MKWFTFVRQSSIVLRIMQGRKEKGGGVHYFAVSCTYIYIAVVQVQNFTAVHRDYGGRLNALLQQYKKKVCKVHILSRSTI